MLAMFIAREAGEARVDIVTRAPDEGESLSVEVMDEEVLARAVMAVAAAWRWDRECSAARV
jgi:hypothetical protein